MFFIGSRDIRKMSEVDFTVLLRNATLNST